MAEIGIQWWLVKLNQHGNPTPWDGPHDDRGGADKALYLIQRLGLVRNGDRYAVARIELSEPEPFAGDIDEAVI